MICVDRIDYALREVYHWLNPGVVSKSLSGIMVYNNEIIFEDEEHAFIFASNFLELQTRNWGSKETVRRVYLLAKVLKMAYDNDIITRNDFYGEEADIIKKIEAEDIFKMKEIIARLKSDKIIVRKRKLCIVKKFRYVDPKIMNTGSLQRLSDIDKNFRKKLEKQRTLNRKGVIVR